VGAPTITGPVGASFGAVAAGAMDGLAVVLSGTAFPSPRTIGLSAGASFLNVVVGAAGSLVADLANVVAAGAAFENSEDSVAGLAGK
jgi:hypothetical protein